MRRRFEKKRNQMLLFVTAAALLCLPLRVYATNADIADSKKKINENKEKMEALKAQKYEVEDKLSELNQLKSDAAAYVQKLDQEVASLTAELAQIEQQMTEKEAEIAVTEDELSAAQETERRQYSSMKQRIKYMYERGDMNYLDMLFESKSFSELLNKAEYIRQVSEYDREKLNEYAATRETIAQTKTQLEAEYADLAALKESAENRRSATEALQADKEKELASYNEKIRAAQKDISEMQTDIAGIQAAIKAEENNIAAIEAELKRKEEEAKKAAAQKGETYTVKNLGDISFTWPLPGSSRITSKFGDRESPTEGASSNHKGIDIGAATGTKIVAAAEGDVVIATYSASAGNYVMINHGGGVYTVYMHMSSIAVSVGDHVQKGGSVGAVGSTGYSTGPHLHFGVRYNGTYVNPLSYVSP